MATTDISSEENVDVSDVCEAGFYRNNWKECANSLSTIIWNRHSWYDDELITICKLQCRYKVKGRVSNYKWVWDAKFGCDEKTPENLSIVREYTIRKNAIKDAISNFLQQSFILRKLKPNDFTCN